MLFTDSLLTRILEAEVVCTAHILGKPIQPLYYLVDARTGLSAGRDPLPCLIQDADGGLFHISQEAPPPDLPPVNEDYVKVLDKLYPKDSKVLGKLHPKDSQRRIVLDMDQAPFFTCILKGSRPPEGYFVSIFHPPDAYNLLGYNRHHHVICVHHTSKFGPDDYPQISFNRLFPKFCIPFQNKEDALINGLIKDIVKRRVDEIRINAIENSPNVIKKALYSPMVHFCNTSGSGKTRTCLELGNYTNVIYLKYAGNHGTSESAVATFLRKFIVVKCKNLHYAECYPIQHAVLQRLIYICCQYCQAANSVEGSVELDHAVEWFCRSARISEDMLESVVFDGIQVEKMSKTQKDLFDTGKFEGMLESSDQVSFDGKSLAEIERLNSEWLKSRATSMPSRLKMSKEERDELEHLPNLVLVFDEAFALMTNSGDESTGAISVLDTGVERKTDCYQILRGTLRHYSFYWIETISITVSTVAKYTQFYPPLHKDPSFRERKVIPMLTPIVLTGTFDAFNHGTINSNDFKDWLSFIFSFERCIMIANCGRPLWAAEYGKMMLGMIQDFKRQSLPSCRYDVEMMKGHPFNFLNSEQSFLLAASKICSEIEMERSGPRISLNDDNALMSLLSLSIAMTKFPCRVDSAELVRTGGMCLFDVDSEDIKAAFVSEGIFNGIASYVVAFHFNSIVKHLGNLFATNPVSFIMKSEVGEIVERLLIINSVVKARRSGLCKALGVKEGKEQAKNACRTVFEPVGLADFLVEFVGMEATDEYMKSCPGLEGSFVAFNHFDYMDNIEDSPYDAVANYLSRGAALVSRSCTTILPLVLSDGRLSFVYIQTRMGSSQPYLKLPTVGDVSMSSPLNRWKAFFSGEMANWDPNTPIPPYAYIYHHINSSEYEFAVIDGPLDKHQQPCLALSGIHDNDGAAHGSVIGLVRLFDGVEVEPWLAINSSMLRSWKLPSTEPHVRADFDNNILLASRVPSKDVARRIDVGGKKKGKQTEIAKKRPAKRAKSS